MNERIDVTEIISPVLGLAEPASHDDRTAISNDSNFCRHRAVDLDGKTRKVRCRGCNKSLDAFDVLLDYARGERTWRTWETLVRSASENLQKLKAEEKRAKARMKHASRKDSEAAVAAERLRTERMRMEITETARDITQLCRRIERLAKRG